MPNKCLLINEKTANIVQTLPPGEAEVTNLQAVSFLLLKVAADVT